MKSDTFLAILCNFWKNSGEASLSPPSDWMGSTTIPATGIFFLLYVSIKSSTSARHLQKRYIKI